MNTYELTSDKKALIVTNENKRKISVLVENIAPTIDAIQRQKATQDKRFDDEIEKWTEYAKAAEITLKS